MCLPWAITNWVWEFYSFKNALGAQSLSQRPRHGLGTDGKIFLKLYDFLNILTRSIWKKKRGNRKTMIIQHNLTEETKKLLDVRRSSSISSIANFATFRHSDHSAMIRSTDFFDIIINSLFQNFYPVLWGYQVAKTINNMFNFFPIPQDTPLRFSFASFDWLLK